MTYFVYIIKGFRSGYYRYYKGYTNNIKRRYLEHKMGRSKYTRRFNGNLHVVYIEVIKDRNIREEKKRARRRELQLKKWNRKKIERVIELNQQKIKVLIDLYLN